MRAPIQIDMQRAIFTYRKEALSVQLKSFARALCYIGSITQSYDFHALRYLSELSLNAGWCSDTSSGTADVERCRAECHA